MFCQARFLANLARPAPTLLTYNYFIVDKTMPESKRPLKVFLCHASADKPAVRDLYKRLTADGVDAWLDAESLLPGQKWKIEIPKAIQNSDIILVCLSKESVNKEGFVQKEIRDALDVAKEKLDETIFIIPAKLEDCDVPARLDEYHWVNLYEEGGYKKLIRSLQTRAKTVDATLLPSEVSKIDKVKSKAIELEKASNLGNALSAYYELRKLDPDYSGIDEKINQLKDAIDKEAKEEKVKPENKIYAPRNLNRILGIIIFIVLALASIFGLPALVGEPEPTPAIPNTQSLITLTLSPTIKSQTPTIISSTNTLTPTRISTTTPLPESLRGFNKDCIDEKYWRVFGSVGETIPTPTNNCYNLINWGVVVNNGQFSIIEPSSLGVTRAIYTEFASSQNIEVNFNVQVNELSKLNYLDQALVLGVGASNELLTNGHFLFYRVYNGSEKVYLQYGTNMRESPEKSVGYSLSEIQEIKFVITGLVLEIFVNDNLFQKALLSTNDHQGFWIGYRLATEGTIDSVISNLSINE